MTNLKTNNAEEAIEIFYKEWKDEVMDFYMKLGKIWKNDYREIDKLELSNSDLELASNAMHFPEDLDKKLTREFNGKKKALFARITKKGIDINNLTNAYLTIGKDGSLNGLIEDANKSIQVTTIVAGGYNIQKKHYRVLIN